MAVKVRIQCSSERDLLRFVVGLPACFISQRFMKIGSYHFTGLYSSYIEFLLIFQPEISFTFLELLDTQMDPSFVQIYLINLHHFRQLSNVIQELIQIEKNYVSSLERGIATYIDQLDAYARNYPALLGKKYHIFGNIERLHAFHKEELLPSLIECNNDVVYIADLFYKFITKDYFYGYVLFSLNKPRAEKLTWEYKEFFDRITKESEDKLGVNSFLLQPIQILPRYKLLFGEIIKVSV